MPAPMQRGLPSLPTRIAIYASARFLCAPAVMGGGVISPQLLNIRRQGTNKRQLFFPVGGAPGDWAEILFPAAEYQGFCD